MLRETDVTVFVVSWFDCSADLSENEVLQAKSHYTQAVVDGCSFNLYDYAHVKVSLWKLSKCVLFVNICRCLQFDLWIMIMLPLFFC